MASIGILEGDLLTMEEVCAVEDFDEMVGNGSRAEGFGGTALTGSEGLGEFWVEHADGCVPGLYVCE
jgi:hypothetical protein